MTPWSKHLMRIPGDGDQRFRAIVITVPGITISPEHLLPSSEYALFAAAIAGIGLLSLVSVVSLLSCAGNYGENRRESKKSATVLGSLCRSSDRHFRANCGSQWRILHLKRLIRAFRCIVRTAVRLMPKPPFRVKTPISVSCLFCKPPTQDSAYPKRQ